MDETGGRGSNRSVSKLMQIFASLGNSRMPVCLKDVAAEIEMPQATALRYLNALIELGFVYQTGPSGRYALTWKVCGLGEQIRASSSLRSLSGTLIEELSSRLELGASLSVEQDMGCLYLDCVYEPAQMGPTLQRIGKQTPLHTTSSGKLFLSAYSEEDIDRLIRTKGLPSLTENTITTKSALLREIEKVRRQRYATDREECEKGLKCCAVPVYDYHEKIIAAVSVFGSAEKMDDARLESELLPAMAATAREISFRTGCSRYPAPGENG